MAATGTPRIRACDDADFADGVSFVGAELDGRLIGVMGVQPVNDVALIRHAYVVPALQRAGR